MLPPLFLRCFSAARPPRTGRAPDEMRGKVEASIDQPLRERQATKGTAGTDIRGIWGSNQATLQFLRPNTPFPPPVPTKGRPKINRR